LSDKPNELKSSLNLKRRSSKTSNMYVLPVLDFGCDKFHDGPPI
jgi:hypothetical protein